MDALTTKILDMLGGPLADAIFGAAKAQHAETVAQKRKADDFLTAAETTSLAFNGHARVLNHLAQSAPFKRQLDRIREGTFADPGFARRELMAWFEGHPLPAAPSWPYATLRHAPLVRQAEVAEVYERYMTALQTEYARLSADEGAKIATVQTGVDKLATTRRGQDRGTAWINLGGHALYFGAAWLLSRTPKRGKS